MKILSINNTADVYGSARCMERVFGRFAREGHEVHAVLPKAGPLVGLLEAQGVHVHIHPELRGIERRHFRSLAGFLDFVFHLPLSVISLARLIRKQRIDVVHTNSLVLPTPALAALLTGRTHIWHVRELVREFGSLSKPYQHVVHRLSSAIVAISQCTLDDFLPALRDKIHVIYDGLDESAFQVNPVHRSQIRGLVPSEVLLVGVIGRIKWHRKGQEILVKAAALLKHRHPDVRYVIIGSAAPGNEDHEVRLRALIDSLGLHETIALLGDTQDPASAFAALDIAVVPPVDPEPFGCVVIEAMAAGTPVVGSDSAGISEQIVDGISGLVFTPGDAEALARELDRLFVDRGLRERLAEAGLRRVRDTFSLESTCRAMADLFTHVATARSGRAPAPAPHRSTSPSNAPSAASADDQA